MKIGVIIQARSGSTRLPGKVLLNLGGKTVLERVVERVRASKLVNGVVVATTLGKDDDAIEALCVKAGVDLFRGSEDDVLDRFYKTAQKYQIEHIVRITADCPLMDAEVIDAVVALHLKEGSDYTSNTIVETYPDGEDVEVFSFEALKRAWAEASLRSEREHVTPYLKKNQALFKVVNLKCETDLSAHRWTLDEGADYVFIKNVYAALDGGKAYFGMKTILAFLAAHPEVAGMNKGIVRNEGYAKSLKEDARVV